MNTELFKSKTFWTGAITGALKIVNAFTGVITPELEKTLTEFAMLAMGIFIRDGIAKSK